MVEKIKLKHLRELNQQTPNLAPLMKDIDGFKKSRFNRTNKFIASYKRMAQLVREYGKVDAKLLSLSDDCKIKMPTNIDNITFSAMMELRMLISKGSEMDIIDAIIETIAIACFSENNEGKFDTESSIYNRFKTRIEDLSAISMIGLFNWIQERFNVSQDMWDERFESVYVEDPDYLEAGGERMRQFNVIITIKDICNDFNVPYDDAWQIPYGIVSANSYAKATSGHIQSQMTDIKERKLKQKNGNH